MSTKTLTLNTADFYLQFQKSLPLSSQSPFLSPPIPSSFPLSKIIPRTRFIVDGFRIAGDFSISYFLSHFHSDIYSGLTSEWSRGIIFCSEATGRLATEVLGISPLLVVRLPVNETVLIDGCEVTLIDANHCPGAVQFLFRVPIGDGNFEQFVHTGDFRYHPSMKLEPSLSQFIGCDILFLDTAYFHPKFVFPSHEESIDYIVSVIKRVEAESRNAKSRVLFLVATSIIGKENVLTEISRMCGCKFHVNSRIMEILKALGHANEEVFTVEKPSTNVHLVGWNALGESWPYFQPDFVKMEGVLAESGYSKVVGFGLTGWTREVKRNKFVVRTNDSLEIHLVPYCEHSNFDELKEYVRYLKPKRIVPTLEIDDKHMDSKYAIKIQKHIARLVDEVSNEQERSMGFFHVPFGKSKNEMRDKMSGLDLVGKPTPQTSNLSVTISGPSSSSQEPGSRCSVLLSDKEKEEIVQELRDCLPTWVPEDQMLELIQICGRDIIDVVSYFYEHETEFHGRFGQTISSSQSNSNTDCTSALISGSDEANPSKQVRIPNQNLKFLPLKPLVVSSVSPAKKRKKPVNNRNKKSKVNSNIQQGGKQSTITKFFSKHSSIHHESNTDPSPGGCTANKS